MKRIGLFLLVLLGSGCDSEIRMDSSALAAATAAGSLADAETSRAFAGTDAPVPDQAGAEISTSTVLYSEHDAEVTARRRGVVREIRVELGDAISAGQELARLEDDEERAALEAAAAALDLARLAHERTEYLAGNALVARAELDDAESALRVAEAELRAAEIALAHTRVTAPFAGAITRRFVRIGQLVEIGEPLFRTTALRPLRASLRLPERQAHALQNGRFVEFSGVDGQDAVGRIIRVAPAIDPASGTIEVLVDLPDPRGLLPGSAVRAVVRDPISQAP